MNLSEVFLVTFSILYGIMLNSCFGLSLFPFGRLFGFDTWKPKLRILISFIVINLAPFALFSWVLPKLRVIEDMPTSSDFFGVFLVSTIVFGFSRFLQMLIALCEGKWFYDLKKEKLSPSRKKHIEMVTKSSWKGHSIGIITYLLLFAFGWLCIAVL